jgi:hypothetical protein
VDWDILDQINDKDTSFETEDIPIIDWEQLENLEIQDDAVSLREAPITSENKPSVESHVEENEPEEDPWRVCLAEPVDWVKELGGATFTTEEQRMINEQLLASDAAWATHPMAVSTGYSWYWVEFYIPRKFRDVFDETNRPKRERKAQDWLRELPGGFSDSLDFLQILSHIGERAFIKEGSWTSRFGFVSSHVRQKLYSRGGKKWYRTHVSGPRAKAEKQKKKHGPTYGKAYIC